MNQNNLDDTRSLSCDSDATIVIEGGFVAPPFDNDDISITTEEACLIADQADAHANSLHSLYASLVRVAGSVDELQNKCDRQFEVMKELQRENERLKKENYDLKAQLNRMKKGLIRRYCECTEKELDSTMDEACSIAE